VFFGFWSEKIRGLDKKWAKNGFFEFGQKMGYFLVNFGKN
jgi:hypothetical protein